MCRNKILLDNITILHCSYSCGIDLRNGKFVVTGGRQEHGGGKLVTEYNEDGYLRTLPKLKFERREHACSMFKNAKGQIVSK